MPPSPKKEIQDSLQRSVIHQAYEMKCEIKVYKIETEMKGCWSFVFFNASHRTSGTKNFSPGFRVVVFKKEALPKVQFLSHARQKKNQKTTNNCSWDQLFWYWDQKEVWECSRTLGNRPKFSVTAVYTAEGIFGYLILNYDTLPDLHWICICIYAKMINTCLYIMHNYM